MRRVAVAGARVPTRALRCTLHTPVPAPDERVFQHAGGVSRLTSQASLKSAAARCLGNSPLRWEDAR
eukprot:6363001-Prymnesium_polylepis.2